jgi:flagellar biosynthesis anti-sigma factor FlgM
MRIDLTHSAASQISSESTNAESVMAPEVAGSTGHEHEDRTTFSYQTESLNSLVKTAMSSPDVRQEKVDSFKAVISSGTYELNPAKIAASMIDEHA